MKSISRFVIAIMATSGLFLVVQFACAHHSTTGQISEEITEITGTIKEFQFKNPHSWIQVNVTDADGSVVEWSVEWGNPNNLIRRGYSPQTFPSGAEVSIRLRQHLTGAPMGEFEAAKFADGKTVGDWEG